MTGSGNGMDGEGVRLRVAFVLLPNFTLLPFAGFMDVLRLAADEGDRSRQIACRWVVTSVDRAPGTGQLRCHHWHRLRLC